MRGHRAGIAQNWCGSARLLVHLKQRMVLAPGRTDGRGRLLCGGNRFTLCPSDKHVRASVPKGMRIAGSWFRAVWIGMVASRRRETDLYPPIKRLLEEQGYEVKSEIGAADVVAVRDGGDPVVVELKTGFALSLFHQAIDRQQLTDAVYVTVSHGAGQAFGQALRNNLRLCRRLGLGLITVRAEDGLVQIHCDPTPYRPRQSKARRGRLLREFARRVGDPNSGGSTRRGLMTAYRQDALRCVQLLHEHGPTKASEVAKRTGVKEARRLMADDHYGWFDRVRTGVYALSSKGVAAVAEYADAISALGGMAPTDLSAIDGRP